MVVHSLTSVNAIVVEAIITVMEQYTCCFKGIVCSSKTALGTHFLVQLSKSGCFVLQQSVSLVFQFSRRPFVVHFLDHIPLSCR